MVTPWLQAAGALPVAVVAGKQVKLLAFEVTRNDDTRGPTWRACQASLDASDLASRSNSVHFWSNSVRELQHSVQKLCVHCSRFARSVVVTALVLDATASRQLLYIYKQHQQICWICFYWTYQQGGLCLPAHKFTLT